MVKKKTESKHVNMEKHKFTRKGSKSGRKKQRNYTKVR